MELVMDNIKEIKCYCGHTITCDCEPLKKQTAVEWLLEQVPRIETITASSVLEQAKEMEKQQIMQAVYDSMSTNFDPNMGRAELYYKEKYGK